ncbi:MAG: AmmeMemoRadiSam system protein B [Acidobacteriota bacterium]|nr:AmmeMemoRadiSam system protein B [Acidobacteriota bacterium]
MANVRKASVAGTFYPADPARLRDHVETMLAEACSLDDSGAQSSPAPKSVATPVPLALIAPHAGYIYSGPIAASAFKILEALSRPIHRVVVIGPSHFVPFSGVALPEAEVFETPLGKIPVDIAAIDRIRNIDPIVTWDEPHRREHGIEVELPFLQTVLGDFGLVPLVTGHSTAEQVAKIIDALWCDRTIVVVSSDLSHFHNYDTAVRLDAETADAVVNGRPQDLDERSACGHLAIQGLMIAAERLGRSITLIDLRNSGDTNGPRDEVVGYGAFFSR